MNSHTDHRARQHQTGAGDGSVAGRGRGGERQPGHCQQPEPGGQRPSNTPYNPWVLDHTANPANLDTPTTRQMDNRNTIEQVTVDDPPAGIWNIEVNGANVPSGPQTYYVTYEFLGSS